MVLGVKAVMMGTVVQLLYTVLLSSFVHSCFAASQKP